MDLWSLRGSKLDKVDMMDLVDLGIHLGNLRGTLVQLVRHFLQTLG